jgi:anti-sigma factor RsiW
MTTVSRARPSARCRALLALLSDYIDGMLPAGQLDLVETHCLGCDRCRRMVSSLRRTVALCRAAGRTPMPTAAERRARARVRTLLEHVDADKPPGPRRRRNT